MASENEHDLQEITCTDDQQNVKTTTCRLTRHDSLYMEARGISSSHNQKSKVTPFATLLLAFQSLGIVYGDIGTSPLYVYAGVFEDDIKHNDDVLGALGLILYTLALIPLLKYSFIALRANDNGEGGTFALYSLVCRHADVGLIPNEQPEDHEVSNFRLQVPNMRVKRATQFKSMLENNEASKYILLLTTMLGTAMVIGDGVLTPCISVLSAVGGIKEATPKLNETAIVWISVAILVILFMVQQFGTEKVAYSFAPIIFLWFLLIAGIGIYNFIKFDPTVLKGLYPKYIWDYFARNGVHAWISLGGVVLCTTGAEALFADLGHFSVMAIQISMCTVTYPALLCAYTGQAAFLRKHNEAVKDTFYKSLPHPLYWPMFVIAVLASVIASQALISGCFSIIQQSLTFGCFPGVKVVHTSVKHEGQVFIPEANYILMIACVVVTLVFRSTEQMSSAYGIAVVFVMTLTSAYLVIIMVMIWKTRLAFIVAYIAVIGSVELLYLSSVLYKFNQGGYLPLAFAAFLTIVMYIWNEVFRRSYYYELDNILSPDKFSALATRTNLRLPGLAMFYSELAHGIPPIFKHYAENLPAMHSVLVFVCVKGLPISKVPQEERFLFRRVKPHELNVFRCIVRYGYSDVTVDPEPAFENMLIEKLKDFICDSTHVSEQLTENETPGDKMLVDEANIQEVIEREIERIDNASKAGVVHLIGESEVMAKKGSNIAEVIMIDYAYSLLHRNLRAGDKYFEVSHKRMLKVGMTYEI